MSAHAGAIKWYFGVFGVLMVGTILTYYAAFQDLGIWNTPVALFIAVVKAVCVVLIFMHVKDSSKLTKITVVAGLFWLMILFFLTMVDFASRPWS
jgi:cytochrome c oxidase subunit 4